MHPPLLLTFRTKASLCDERQELRVIQKAGAILALAADGNDFLVISFEMSVK